MPAATPHQAGRWGAVDFGAHLVRALANYRVSGNEIAGIPSIAFIENRKVVRWRDYMDSLAAWTALTTGV